MLKNKRFNHSGIVYHFLWNCQNHQKLVTTTNQPETRILWRYLEQVQRGRIPRSLFNNKSLPRMSQFRIKGLKRGVSSKIAKELIEAGEIEVFGRDGKISQMVETVFENFNAEGIKKKPGHEPVLNYILIQHPNSIAVEVPVWRKNQKPITGHIDLLQVDSKNREILVLDYKPEGNFIRSLPQICCYGLFLQRIVAPRKFTVRCVSFNRDASWYYNPEILIEQITPRLIQRGQEKIPWLDYIA